jgi:hypothetical protein
MENNKKWVIELTEEQLQLISRAVEFTSRFHCGQISHTFLPYETQTLIDEEYKTLGTRDWDKIRNKREIFDTYGNLIKNLMYPELGVNDHSSYGVNKHDYSDNLYDIYKQINVAIKKERDSKLPEEEIYYNVDSSFTKFGNLPNINLKPIEDEPKKD